jgi:hypothetical protein
MNPLVDFRNSSIEWRPAIDKRVHLVLALQIQHLAQQGQMAYCLLLEKFVTRGDSAAEPERLFAGIAAKPALPPKYAEYQDVFSKENADLLPQYSEHNHAIKIEGKAPPYQPVYKLSEKEL